MRLLRRRRRAAVVVLLLTFAVVIFLTSRMPVLLEDNVSRSHVRRGTPHLVHTTNRRHSQAVFKDLVNKERSPKENIFQNVGKEQIEYIPTTDHTTWQQNEDNASQIFQNTHWMTIHGGGRLGNAMFQYASLIGISSYHGYKSTLQSSHSLRRVFKLKSSPSTSVKKAVQIKREKNPGIFDSTLLELSHDTNWTLIGYYQSWRYFGNITDKIRQEFTFRDNIIKDMLKAAPILANWTRITIGVHVRRGDMASRYERDRGYNVADLGFLNRSMNYFRKKYDNPIFLICSDSITWCKDNLMSDDTMFMKGSREVDLATLAHCDHNIVTSGSFGWWGAWLAGGDVVYFKHFPRENTWLDRQYNRDDYYPPSWVGMD